MSSEQSAELAEELALLKLKMRSALDFIRHCITHVRGLKHSSVASNEDLSDADLSVIERRCNKEILDLTVQDPELDFSALEELD